VPNISFSYPGSDVLHALAFRAVASTQADGLAIALDRGSGMLCEASTGAAPAVGTTVGPGSTLSETCIREGRVVAYTREADETGDAYSTVLAPIILESRAIGLCAAFANRANAFTDEHIAALKETAAAVCRITETVDVPAPAGLSADILREMEDQIAEFAASERRRQRMAITVRFGVVLLLAFALTVSFAPERLAAWVSPIVKRLHLAPNKQPRYRTGDNRAIR